MSVLGKPIALAADLGFMVARSHYAQVFDIGKYRDKLHARTRLKRLDCVPSKSFVLFFLRIYVF